MPAGSYVENFPDITHDLTVDAVGGLASLTTPRPVPVNGRAILDVPFDAGVSLSISGLEISGAVDDPAIGNGAGVLFETGNGLLTVTNSLIHGNQDGILTGGPDAASPGGVMAVIVDHSEVNNNGVDPSNPRFGFDHNIQAGSLTQLTVSNSYIHDALGGHEIKDRALTTATWFRRTRAMHGHRPLRACFVVLRVLRVKFLLSAPRSARASEKKDFNTKHTKDHEACTKAIYTTNRRRPSFSRGAWKFIMNPTRIPLMRR